MVEGQRWKRRLKRTWKKQDEDEVMILGLRRKDALSRLRWIIGVNQIAGGSS